MPSDFLPDNDLQSLWQQQPVSQTAMTAEEVRKLARTFQGRIGRRNMLEYGAGVIAAAAYLFALVAIPNVWIKAGSLLSLAGIAYVCVNLYRRGYKTSVPAGLAPEAGLQFHRQELERQRDLLRGVWSWYLGPLIPGILVTTAGAAVASGRFGRALISVVAVAILCAGIGWLNQRGAKQLQREIDRLNELSKEEGNVEVPE